ncbi:DNA-binding response OmpR family regulator [Luteibacter rhizovicinus]|uniref:DNA-binding response OmpR family regulator n=1 Tax=Luteibacter rhizovicinus TaxID=242606 RepID=A0A4R3YZ05_9GAMM|nr:response regulator transcription factor [Luteibacter rhizovicinus]TCV97108.1 DNA-binding response OmpR family regulator [Luteibacter rhizovicinus]
MQTIRGDQVCDTPRSRRVAVLEDDPDLREGILLPGLRDFGFTVSGAGTAADLYRQMISHSFDMVVLDIGLPDEDGLTVARHLRQLSDMGIVMLTGSRGKNNHVRALQIGADSYLPKPVDVEVLAATLHSLSRRMATARSDGAASSTPGTTPWRLDSDGWCLIGPTGGVLALTAPERGLLQALMTANGQPVARETLIATLCNDVYAFDPHRLEMLVYRLRRKATEAGAGTLPLLTSRGSGYLFVAG